MNVVFRTDASSTIGLGHLVRCLTLGAELAAGGATVGFVCRDQGSQDLIARVRQGGHDLVLLPCPPSAAGEVGESAWLGVDWETDASETVQAIAEMGGAPDWLVVDHYGIDYRWHQRLRPFVSRLMVIDDKADRPFECDLLLNQNLLANIGDLYTGLIPQSAGQLLGPTFALLHPEYARRHAAWFGWSDDVKRVTISFGGSDVLRLTEKAVLACISLGRPEIAIDVVVGDPRLRTSLQTLVSERPEVTVHEALPSLSELLSRTDLAIGAAGATSWERICLAVPSLVTVVAENQCKIHSELIAQGLAGDLGPVGSLNVDSIARVVAETLRDIHLVRGRLAAHVGLVDGWGVRRVGESMRRFRSLAPVARWSMRSDVGALLAMPESRPEGLLETGFAGTGFPHRNVGRTEAQVVLADGLDHQTQLPLSAVVFGEESRGLRIDWCGSFLDRSALDCQRILGQAIGFVREQQKGGGLTILPPCEARLRVSVCSDRLSWINATVAEMVGRWGTQDVEVTWVHDARELSEGDVCFLLSYSRIVGRDVLRRHGNNLVVHASDLPRGRGWSPLTWQILAGTDSVTVSLFEAEEELDSGPIYQQRKIEFDGSELVNELRAATASATRELCEWFVAEYPQSSTLGRAQSGEPTYYGRRRPADSRLDPGRALQDQFELLRVCDPAAYPAWFELRGRRFRLSVDVMEADGELA